MGTQLPLPKGHISQFSAHICCVQMAGWIKMPLGRDVGLSPSDIVLHGDPSPLPEKGTEPPIFGSCLLQPKGWMYQDVTWYGSRPQPRPHYVRWGPSSPSPRERGTTAPLVSAHVYCGHISPSQLLLSSCFLIGGCAYSWSFCGYFGVVIVNIL